MLRASANNTDSARSNSSVCAFNFNKDRNAGKQFTAIYRLGKKIISSGGNASYPVFGVCKSRHQDDGRKTSIFIGFDPFTDFKSMRTWHHYVEQYKVRPGGSQTSEEQMLHRRR